MAKGIRMKVYPVQGNVCTGTTKGAEVLDPIMKRKSLEQQVRASRNKFQTIFDGMTERFICIDREYRILAVNRFTQQLIRQEFAEITGRYCYEILPCTLNKSEHCAAKKAFETGEISTVTYSDFDQDGKGIHLDMHAFPLKDEKGHTIQVIEHTRDVSEVKRLQDQLIQSEKMGAIGSLAAGIAHELRNPLAIMTSAAQFCLTQIGSDEMLRENLNIIIRSAQAANRVVKELLDFAKPSEPRFEMGSISRVIQGACSLVRSRALKQNVKLTINCPPNLPRTRLDRRHVQEALVNFLLNSLDAMGNKGRLTVTASHLPQHRFVGISIMDTGCGVPREWLSRLFDPFFTTKKNGIGLGMSVSRRVIESHGGTVNLESTPGKGATITIKLPVLTRYGKQERDTFISYAQAHYPNSR